MRGSTHVLVGLASPLWVVLPGASLTSCGVAMAVAAGASLGPDLDHPRSTASTRLPRAVHVLVHRLSKKAKISTATGKDAQDIGWALKNRRDPYHRGVTHTAVAAAVFGVLVWAVCLVPFAPAAVAGGMAWLSCAVMRGRGRFTAPLAAGAVTAMALAGAPSPFLMGACAAAGWMSSVVADGCTVQGVPMLWPFPVHGKRWWMVKLCGSSVESGSPRELVAAVVIVAAMLVPLVQVYS